jgi:hypothetical protein
MQPIACPLGKRRENWVRGTWLVAAGQGKGSKECRLVKIWCRFTYWARAACNKPRVLGSRSCCFPKPERAPSATAAWWASG